MSMQPGFEGLAMVLNRQSTIRGSPVDRELASCGKEGPSDPLAAAIAAL